MPDRAIAQLEGAVSLMSPHNPTEYRKQKNVTTNNRKNFGNTKAFIYNNISFESSLDQGFKKLSLNDVASFVAQLWCIKLSAMCQA